MTAPFFTYCGRQPGHATCHPLGHPFLGMIRPTASVFPLKEQSFWQHMGSKTHSDLTPAVLITASLAADRGPLGPHSADEHRSPARFVVHTAAAAPHSRWELRSKGSAADISAVRAGHRFSWNFFYEGREAHMLRDGFCSQDCTLAVTR